ncbi:sensor histidine kinase [Streptomyces sp. NRRL B-1347]|uniref:sensor histidine kinase n=1 Tax=Streptomyces sp. NRRL B-1347 TaxID=1476877 RepID=UPI000AF97857|nr:sensor histidine kinase [Streptomyces sp. NRRL B-1347]
MPEDPSYAEALARAMNPQGVGSEPEAPAPFGRRAAGLLLGIATSFLALLYFLTAGLGLGVALLWPRTRPGALRLLRAGAGRLTAIERWRRSAFFADTYPSEHDARKDLPYLASRIAMGPVSAAVVGLLGVGVVLAGLLAYGAVRGTISAGELLGQVLLGSALLFLDVQGLVSLAGLDERLARRCFGPSDRELLERRVLELAASRAGIVQVVDVERRRIERDLHDGVQQRLVALAMLLGRANRNPDKAAELLQQAHIESREVLGELREVAWRAYPSALDSLGLEEALAGVAERCSIPLHIDFRLTEKLPQSTETATYFVVSESVTNAAKHSGADRIDVSVGRDRGKVVIQVRDNGRGGADPEGSGLSGLRRRAAALDGDLHVHSPLGGPTTITAELPCA